jgi:hypothetical protein
MDEVTPIPSTDFLFLSFSSRCFKFLSTEIMCMSRLSKRATVYVGDDPVRNVPVYTVDGVRGVRDLVVNMYRVPYDTVNELPDVVDVEWAGHEYVAEFEGMTEKGNPIYSFELQTPEPQIRR